MPEIYPCFDQHDPDALVVYCSDPRFGPATTRFLAQDLALRKPFPIIVPGGIHDLVSPARAKSGRHLAQQIEFVIRRSGVSRAVLVSHEDCLWYRHWNALVPTRVEDDQPRHLRVAADWLRKRFGLDVLAYMAERAEDGVVFRQVVAGDPDKQSP